MAAPPKAVAGLTAVGVTLGQAKAQTGLWRGLRVLQQVNQVDGFDCPGCAWPDPHHRSRFEFCENGAKATLDEATTRRADRAFFARWSIQQLAAQRDQWLNAQGRLTEPMYKASGASHYVPISWQEAAGRVGTALRATAPSRAAFYTSGRTSNEAAFLYQLFARAYGTNNLPDCSNLCHESSGVALKEAVGVGKGTVLLEDFALADLIVVVGQNPGSNHPRMLSTLREAKLRGATVVGVNPLVEPGLVRFKHPQKVSDVLGHGVPMADHVVRVQPGGDFALFRGVGKALLELHGERGDVLDAAFLAEHTQGFEAWAEVARAVEWGELEAASGVSATEMRGLAQRFAASRATIATWAMGLTQHPGAVATIREVVNVMLLRGNIGRPGAGLCPVRGHSNVQGDRTMGIATHMPAWFYDALDARFGLTVPRQPGLDTVGAIAAMARGEIDVLVSLGGNLVSAASDTEYTSAAMRNCQLTVQISTKLNRSHLVTGREALILPCLGRTERDLDLAGKPRVVTVEDSFGVVHASRGSLPSASASLRSEPAIVGMLADATLGPASIPWLELGEDYAAIRRHIEAVVPGFASMEQRIAASGGFVLPNAARDRVFHTPNGKAQLSSEPLWYVTRQSDELVLTTVRSHDQFNTTIYSEDDRYRGVRGERRVLFMHADDMAHRGIRAGQGVRVTSHHAEQTRSAELIATPYDIPRGVVAAYFPEANVLVPHSSVATKSGTPASKSVLVTVRAS